MFRGKKYQESAKLIDRSVQYDPTEALDLVVKGATLEAVESQVAGTCRSMGVTVVD